MPIIRNEYNENSKGGTELLIKELEENVNPDLLSQVNIYPSRIRGDIDNSKPTIYWLHDLPEDPESAHLLNGGWEKFDKLVFVTNWQMQKYIDFFNIPWSKCAVMQNAITRSPQDIKKNGDTIKLIYHTTPHRGLNILIPVFKKLTEKYDNIELDVYSSLKIYGWEDRDKQFEFLYDQCREHPKINYHGSQPYEVVRKAVDSAHIFAYPNIWQETSCRCLMEAMSAGCMSVHPNFGALSETAAGWTWMYQWNENLQEHASVFYSNLVHAIENYNQEAVQSKLYSQKSYADVFYSWNMRSIQWNGMLESVIDSKK